MRRLRDFQRVSLSAGKVGAQCRVVAVGGEQTVLMPEVEGALDDVALPHRAALGFETGSHPVMLSGLVDEGPVPGTLRFFVTDRIGVREWRWRPRLSGAFDVSVAPAHAEEGLVRQQASRYRTADISAGGAFVEGMSEPADSLHQLELELPGMDVIRCHARVVRCTARGAALEFTDLEEDVARRLDVAIYGVRQALCRKATERAIEQERLGRGEARALRRPFAA